MTLDEILLVKLTNFNIWFYILYTMLVYLILKVLYKNKSQITDIFIFVIASLCMLIINAIIYVIIANTIKEFIVYAIISRIILFIALFKVKNKLYNITKLYKKLWNRNDKFPKKIKSTTFRSINIIIFNLTFYLAHIILLFEMTKI